MIVGYPYLFFYYTTHRVDVPIIILLLTELNFKHLIFPYAYSIILGSHVASIWDFSVRFVLNLGLLWTAVCVLVGTNGLTLFGSFRVPSLALCHTRSFKSMIVALMHVPRWKGFAAIRQTFRHFNLHYLYRYKHCTMSVINNCMSTYCSPSMFFIRFISELRGRLQ